MAFNKIPHFLISTIVKTHLHLHLFLFFTFIFSINVPLQAQTNACNNNAGGEITVGTSCNPVAMNSTNNNDYWNSATGCGATDQDDVWAWFIATSTSTTISYTPATNRDAILTLLTGACSPTMASLACANDGANGFTETIVLPTTIGTRYRIRVQRNGSNANMNGIICVYNGSGCAGSFFDSGGAGADYTNNENATNTYCSGIAGQCVQMTFNSFSTESCCDELTIYDGTNASAPQIGVFRGTTLNGQTIQSTTGCLTFIFTSDGSVVDAGWDASISCVACPTCSDGIQNGLENGVDCGGPTCPPCPCNTLAVSNDEACCATPLTVNADQNCTTVTAGTVNNATASFNAMGCAGPTANDDVWYSFVATSSEHDVTLSNVAGSTTDLYHAVYGGTCSNTGTELVCRDDDNSSLSGLTIGNTYYIRVFTFGSTGGQNTTFDICVNSPCGNVTEPTCNLNYTHSTTGYNPVNYTNGTTLTFNDDRFAGNFSSIGFDFCFDGVTYQDCMVSSNGYLIFPGCYSEHAGEDVVPGAYSEYEITAAAPNTNNAPRNAIMGPWQDIDPSITGSEIRTRTHGTAPNRVFVVKFNTVGMFDCTTQDFTGQIMLYETSNEIEIHIGEKTICTSFNGGAAIMGLHDYTGTQAVIPAGYNFPTQWAVDPASPEGHRFTPSCPGGVCTILLPTDLLSFEGTAEKLGNQLTWVTASETNNDYYVVEKSVNGYSFFALGSVDGGGTTTTQNTYDYWDPNIEDGTVYYRLRQVGTNGKIAYSKIIAIHRGGITSTTVKVFPNPATSDIVSILLQGEDEIKTIHLTNYLGQGVTVNAAIESPTEVKLNVADLAKGTYLVEIELKHGLTLHKKLIVNK